MIPAQKILIVDDKHQNLVALKQVLGDLDVEVVAALSGNEALAATLDHSFALAILDVMMPEMNGFELAEYLRSDAGTRLLPIIFVTAFNPDEKHQFCGYEAGAVDFLVKPYAPEILRAKVRVFLELDRQRQELKWQRDHLDALVAERTRELETELAARRESEREREILQSQLHQAQKLESIGRLAGGVAHDFNNMLSVIIGHAELVLMKMKGEDPVFSHVQEIRGAAERSAELTRQLLAFARKQAVAPQVLDLNRTVEAVLNMLRRLIGEDKSLSFQPGPEVWPVSIDPGQVNQILANLCVNARDAIQGVGTVCIRTGSAHFDGGSGDGLSPCPPGDYALLTVSDTGCGMDLETQANIFEPFFTTKEVGKGTGLGLASVYGAVKQNRGFITVASSPGQGTIFSIYLPRYTGADHEIGENETEHKADGGCETILLVEDEPAILDATQLLLESLGYRVLGTTSTVEAVRLAREHAGKLHLLMTDVIMPDLNGPQLAKNLQAICPGMKQLLMSGYTADIITHDSLQVEGMSFIEKPFSVNTLARKVRHALGVAKNVIQ